jgi:hypothetical protein
VNILKLEDSELTPVDYGDLLDKILEVLQDKNPFALSDDRHRLLIDIDAIAADITKVSVLQQSIFLRKLQLVSAAKLEKLKLVCGSNCNLF